MDGVRAITENINVFVRFFQSINALFCHVRWLEANLRNAPTGLLCVVGAIGGIAVLMYLAPGSDALAPIAIVIVVGVLLVRRWRDGPMRGATFDRILFGDPSDRDGEEKEGQGRSSASMEDSSSRGLREGRDSDHNSNHGNDYDSPSGKRGGRPRGGTSSGSSSGGDVEMGPIATAYPVNPSSAPSYSYPSSSSSYPLSGGFVANGPTRIVPSAAVRI